MLFDHLFDLQNDLERLFDRDLLPGTTFSRGVFPAINMFERGDTLMLKTELPGMEKKDIKIELKDNSINLSGERKRSENEKVSYHRRERNSGIFRRQLNLPYRVNSEKISAKLEKGVLTISLEKADETKPRTITIN